MRGGSPPLTDTFALFFDDIQMTATHSCDPNILQHVTAAFAGFAKVPADDVTPQTKLKAPEFGLDSMDLLSLILRLEDHYGIEIPDEHMNQLHTVADLSRLVKEEQNALESVA